MGRTMNATAWNLDDDLILVDVVLRSIRKGKAMVQAFEEAEKAFSGKRTAGACKFRWSTNLSKKYDQSIEEAKYQYMLKQNVFDVGGDNDMNATATVIESPKNVFSTKKGHSQKTSVTNVTPFRTMSDSLAETTKGIQQTMDFENDAIVDAAQSTADPVVALKELILDVQFQHEYLKSENASLKQQLLSKKQDEDSYKSLHEKSLEELAESKRKIESLEAELTAYAEIKDLLVKLKEMQTA